MSIKYIKQDEFLDEYREYSGENYYEHLQERFDKIEDKIYKKLRDDEETSEKFKISKNEDNIENDIGNLEILVNNDFENQKDYILTALHLVLSL